MKRSQLLHCYAYFFIFFILLSAVFGQFSTNEASIVPSSIGNISNSAITKPTPPVEVIKITTEITPDNLLTSEFLSTQMEIVTDGITDNPINSTDDPEISGNEMGSPENIRVFTKIANNIIQKKLDAVEEKVGKLASKLNGEHSRNSKTVANIAFFAQRNIGFDHKKTIQPYPINRLNDGEAFNQESGIFTAPTNGNYHFYFSALKANAEIAGTSIITVRLWANKNQKDKIPQMLAEGHVNSNDMHGWFPVTLYATVKLHEQDTVEVELLVGSTHESGNPEHVLTSFGGFLVSPIVK